MGTGGSNGERAEARLASVTGYRPLTHNPIGQLVLVKVEEGELHPRDADRLPGVAPLKLEPEGRFVSVCTRAQVVVGSVQVDLRELSVDSSLHVMTSTVPIVVIRGVLNVQVDLRVRSIRDAGGTRGVEDVSEGCARRATRWALRHAGPSGDCVGSWPAHQLPRSTSLVWSYRRIQDRSRCRRAASRLSRSLQFPSHSGDRQRRPGCCAAGSPLRHGYDAGALSRGG